ncbi:phosphoesterase [Paraliobacillus quinghaiensis]|uniref:Phosphoesterase n=1 Tax=Paraliobacillus quinghaiensis TaxID=470815 RepID=A0A917TE27_9BACI|nr:metallophosphoesterase [Paraliobacillus quinghaiensis]GGM18916.1 phosphoesterase [Paraliobacillus quinghaiensis]
MWSRKRIFLYISILLLVAVSIKVYYDTNFFKVNHVAFQTDKLPEESSVTIVQLSDIHNHDFGEGNESLINEVSHVDPDIIVITGDLVDRKTNDLTDVFHLVEELITQNEHVYFVSGNHEWGNTHTAAIFAGLEERNVTILDNTNTTITLGNQTLTLAGVGNSSTMHDDLIKALAGVRKENYTVLLSHTPDISDMSVSTPVDLILSGHTHGGQVRFPLIGGVIAPDQGFFPALDKGTYEWENKKYLYIDSGLGTSLLSIRFLNQSQFSVITIEAE